MLFQLVQLGILLLLRLLLLLGFLLLMGIMLVLLVLEMILELLRELRRLGMLSLMMIPTSAAVGSTDALGTATYGTAYGTARTDPGTADRSAAGNNVDSIYARDANTKAAPSAYSNDPGVCSFN